MVRYWKTWINEFKIIKTVLNVRSLTIIGVTQLDIKNEARE